LVASVFHLFCTSRLSFGQLKIVFKNISAGLYQHLDNP